ncbi:MAG: methylcrotonoyl-CoA carboxylase [Deltaproteobacteria bacterium]|nr:methylcrotonoyl-CoA carboxylase [Deltaproteobacteria bacterium]
MEFPVPVISSQLKTTSTEFRERRAQYIALLDELSAHHRRASSPESAEAIATARQRKKLLTSERLEALSDPGAPILEICPLAGMEMYDGVPPGAGIRTAVLTIKGRKCMVIANNPSVKGGTYFPMTVKKHVRAQEIALENRLPCISLVDSGGAFLPLQAEVFPDRDHFGRIFRNQAVMSASGIPQIAIVLGSCTAGGAYVPAMSDETVMVRGNATIFLGGPPLVKAATGQDVSAEELGGAEVHCTKSGVSDHLVDSEEEAFFRAREIVEHLGEGSRGMTPHAAPEEPLYAPEEIHGILGSDLRKGFPILEVIARLVDGSRFDEFKAAYGTTLKCGFAHVLGMHVGIVANDGILFSESALKAAHFIQLCNQRGIPLVFLQNIVGFMVGKEYEHRGIAKDGAKMVTAVATSRVPKITLLVGGSFGAGNYAMCGRAYDPRFLASWPGSRISVMGGQQAAKVLSEIRYGAKKSVDEKERETFEADILATYEREGSPYFATARLWDDGVIAPLDTRRYLALALSTCHFNPDDEYRPGVFRM